MDKPQVGKVDSPETRLYNMGFRPQINDDARKEWVRQCGIFRVAIGLRWGTGELAYMRLGVFDVKTRLWDVSPWSHPIRDAAHATDVAASFLAAVEHDGPRR